jgi:hypothetical protein
MGDAHTATAQARSQPDREALRAELERTRAAVHAFLDTIPDERWNRRSPGSAWTVREVFVHLTWALEYLPKELELARQGKGLFNTPKAIADPASYLLIRWLALRSTRVSIRRKYDAAMDATLATLARVADGDWSLGANFYGEGFHSVADLFHTPAGHLAEHTRGL